MATIALAPIVSLEDMHLSASWLAALTEIRVEHQFQVPSRCTLRFSDPGYALLESHKVQLGTALEVKDPADEALVLMKGEVTSVAVDQRTGEQPELVVVAHDKSHRLGRATDVKTYLEMTYSNVVSELAESCGLMASTTSTRLRVDYLMQADSDLGLLTELARRVGYDWWVEGTELKFHPPSSDGSVSLPLGDKLRSFSARASGHHPDKVTVDGWDRDKQELVTATAESASSGVKATSQLAGYVERAREAFGSATIMSAGMNAHSKEEASQLSQAVLDRAMACAVAAQGVADGNGNLKLGKSVEVSRAGPLSGKYPLTRIEHLYRPRTGFVTRFFAGDRRPTSLVDTLTGARVVPTPATMHPALTVGQVTNINDEEDKGRVKVRYPGLSSQYETGWARIVSVGGGEDRGQVFIPEVNDEVLVGFEGGDPRQPVVIGGLFGAKSKIPRPLIEEGKVQERGMTSRLGHIVHLLDGTEPEKQAILLQLAGKEHTVHLGKDKLSISVPEGTPIEIQSGDSSVKFSDSGAISISAPSVTVNAEEKISMSAPEIQLSAEGELSLQGDGMAGLKGGEVNVESEGPLSMMGEPVSIN